MVWGLLEAPSNGQQMQEQSGGGGCFGGGCWWGLVGWWVVFVHTIAAIDVNVKKLLSMTRSQQILSQKEREYIFNRIMSPVNLAAAQDQIHPIVQGYKEKSVKIHHNAALATEEPLMTFPGACFNCLETNISVLK